MISTSKGVAKVFFYTVADYKDYSRKFSLVPFGDKPRPFSGVDRHRSNVECLLESRTVRKAVLSRSYYDIISERDIRLALLEIGAILSIIVKVSVHSVKLQLAGGRYQGEGEQPCQNH